MVTLSSFCKKKDIPKSTARDRLIAAGFNTSSGLSVEAQLFLMESFGLNQINVAQPKQEANVDVTTEPVSIVPAGSTLDLSCLRTAGELTEVSNDDLLVLTSQAMQLLRFASEQAKQEVDKSYAEFHRSREVGEQLKKLAMETQMDLMAKAVENRVITALGKQQQAETSKQISDLAAELLRRPSGEQGAVE